MHLLLESRLMAQAFSDTAGLAGPALAWLAVAFAALGFWRIRAVESSPIKPDPQPQPESPPQELKPKPKSTTGTLNVGPAENKLLPSPSCHVQDNGSCSATKGLFTAYFHAEDNDSGWESEDEVDAVSEKETPLTGEWEGMQATLRMRGDLGWYRHVDLTALEGSVVRLWNSNGRLRRLL